MSTFGSKGSLRRRLSLAMIQAADNEQYNAVMVRGFQCGLKFLIQHPTAGTWGITDEYCRTNVPGSYQSTQQAVTCVTPLGRDHRLRSSVTSFPNDFRNSRADENPRRCGFVSFSISDRS